ncbi:MAG: hydrogenase accessory protein HypB, partial [Methylobacillus sp.]|nr:hydrogenase accessory protein HypB [Methylobacillus sp.]
MCTACGCGSGQTLIAGRALKPPSKNGAPVRYRTPVSGHASDHYANSHEHAHLHTHSHGDMNHGGMDFGAGPAGAHAPGLSQARMVQIERDILSKNDDYAQQNRGYLAAHGIFALNLVSSPGSGKTTLLVKTI